MLLMAYGGDTTDGHTPESYLQVIIDVQKLLKGTKLLIDSNYPTYGVYTTSNIPPSAISM